MDRIDLDIQEFVAAFALAEEFRGKRVLVTGARGLIGRCLVNCLSELNRVHQLGIQLECPSHQELGQWLSDSKNTVDFIIHLACPTASKDMVNKPVEVIESIVSLTRQVLEFAQRTKATMVYASSMEVYGMISAGEEISELQQGYVNPLSARSSYPMGKRMAECLCYSYSKEYDVDVKIARLVQTFGAGIAAEDQRVFAQFARSIIANQDIILLTQGKTSRKYLYLTDTVSALLYILLKGNKGDAYNAAHPDSYISIIQMAEMLRCEFNPKIEVRVELKKDAPYPPETQLNLSTKKLEALGWRAQVPLREMFARLIASMQA